MRGKPRAMNANADRVRIIPAHAGQTRSLIISSSMPPDHPRACGANPGLEGPRAWYYGSSPRMRGKRPCRHTGRVADRIIPAHAGQTTVPCSVVRSESDHPRACGANKRGIRTRKKADGSSPRMRGKPVENRWCPRATRIIPAHAGQTHDIFSGLSLFGVGGSVRW